MGLRESEDPLQRKIFPTEYGVSFCSLKQNQEIQINTDSYLLNHMEKWAEAKVMETSELETEKRRLRIDSFGCAHPHSLL